MIGAPQPCRFDGDDAPDAPRVWALAVARDVPGASPEATRQRARDQARATLRALLAEHFALPLSAIALDDRRGARVRAVLVAGTPVPPGWATLGLSISHEADVALIALRTAGPVGVDLAALPVGWPGEDDAADVLQRQAALYLGPDHAAAQRGADAAAFVRGWAALEARLKCLEAPLAEWSPALAARLARCDTAALALPPDLAARLPAPAAAAVAWA